MQHILDRVLLIAATLLIFVGVTPLSGRADTVPAKGKATTQVTKTTQTVKVETMPVVEDEYENVPPYISLALKAGTLGPGAEVTIGVVPELLNIRVGGNYLPLKFSGKIKDVDYSVDINWASVPLMLDWHPFYNNFRITGAMMYNRNRARLDANLNDTQKIGDHDYTPAEIGTLSGSVDFRNFAPYLGIGFGNAVGPDTSWNFVFDVGVMFQGVPGINLSASGGTKSDDPEFLLDLAQEEQDVQDEADKFQFYPVISAGVSYQF